MDLKFDGLDQGALLDAAKIDNGVWIHLFSAKPDPKTGKPVKMYLGGDESKPQRALVRSNRAQIIRDAEIKQQRESMVAVRLAKKADRDDVIANTSTLSDAARFGLQLAALDNFSAAGGVQVVTPEDGAKMFGMTQLAHIVQQVRETAFDDAPYLATADTEVGNLSASTAKATPAAKEPALSPT